MKKMLFAAAAMIAAMTANATVLFDITNASGKTWADAGTLTSASFTTEYQEDGTTWKDYLLKNDAGSEGILSNGNVAISYKNSSSKTAWKIYDSYIQTNGDARVLTISGLSVGDKVNITVAKGGTEGAITTTSGAEETSQTATPETVVAFTATASTMVLDVANKIRISKIETGVATAANDAEADAEFAYSVKINGQKVNAKVYNEPVIEVSSNGAAKVVINKK